MKKTYLTPDIECILLATEDICISSGNEGNRTVNWEDMFNDDGTTKEFEF